MVYLPLGDDDQMPLPGALYQLSRMSNAKIDDGKAVIRGLRDGRYLRCGCAESSGCPPRLTSDAHPVREATHEPWSIKLMMGPAIRSGLKYAVSRTVDSS